MGDHVIVDGDQVVFDAQFGAASVTVKPGTITGTGSATLGGKKACIVGDEANVRVAGCDYVLGQLINGKGTLVIKQLAPDQQARQTANGKPLILKGAKFIAAFEVLAPATDPSTGAADPLAIHPGTGGFQAGNTTVTAS